MKRVLVLMMAAVMLLSCMAGCGSNDAQDSGDGAGEAKALELQMDTFPATLHPHEFTTINEYCIAYNIYEPLVYTTDDGTVQNVLAESFEVSEDGKVYTYKLRQGVKFHNGETMTADDVVYSFEAAMNDPYMATYVSAIESAAKVDEDTVTVTLKDPSSAYVRMSKYITILSKKFCEENESLVSVACGTGPYMLSTYTDGVVVGLTAFADYWQGAASIPGVNYNYISDTATKTMAFESGDLDFISVPEADWDRISSNTDYLSGSTTQDLVYWVVLNSADDVLSDVLVRQAVYCAINKEDALLVAGNGAGVVANVMADPAIIDGATDDFDYLTYDVEKAKDLLAQAGYPDGVDLGEICYIGGTTYEKIAVSVQNSLAQAGITVALKATDDSAIFGDLAMGNFNMGVLGSGLGRDYSLYSQLYTTAYLGALDLCQLQDSAVDEAFATAAITVDKAEREAMYKDLITKLETEAYYVPVYYASYIWAAHPGFTPHIDDGGLQIYYCTME